MSAGLLGLAWVAVVVGGVTALGHRPPRRVSDLRRAAVGRVARLAAPRRAVTAAQTGLALLAPLLVLPRPMGPVLAVATSAAVWLRPRWTSRRRETQRFARLEAELPEVVDLLVLAVGAGLTVPLALDAVARRAHGDLGEELGAVVAATRQGHRLADALDQLPARAGEAVRPLVSALTASERYGAPLAAGLERLANDVRATRRRRADVAARRVSVKLLFPLVLCVLPAFALLTVAPLIASALRSLRL